jgi:hypothetical protein
MSLAASFVLGIHFAKSYFCDSRCPLSKIDNRKHMLVRFRSHFKKCVDVWAERGHQFNLIAVN